MANFHPPNILVKYIGLLNLLNLLNRFSKSIGLLNFRFSPSESHKLSPFEIVIFCPMYLTAAVFGLHLIKGEILQYFAALASIKNNYALLGQSFHSLILEDEENLRITFCILEILSIGKETARRTIFNLSGKTPIKYY